MDQNVYVQTVGTLGPFGVLHVKIPGRERRPVPVSTITTTGWESGQSSRFNAGEHRVVRLSYDPPVNGPESAELSGYRPADAVRHHGQYLGLRLERFAIPIRARDDWSSLTDARNFQKRHESPADVLPGGFVYNTAGGIIQHDLRQIVARRICSCTKDFGTLAEWSICRSRAGVDKAYRAASKKTGKLNSCHT